VVIQKKARCGRGERAQQLKEIGSRALFTHNEVSFVLDKVTLQHLHKCDLTVVEGGVEVIKFGFERNCHVLHGIGRP
jgi:hypothetical protein